MTDIIDEYGDGLKLHQRESLIETKYLGINTELIGTKGEAYFNVGLSQWFYKSSEAKGFKGFRSVDPKEIDCANDSGWVRGNYLGQKNIGKFGKSYWSEQESAWVYKPKGQQKTWVIPEKDFQMVRDEDY